MIHAKQFHHICGIAGCDCVFKDLTSLDLHQAEYHQRKVSLRIATKEEDDKDEEEEKKAPTITPEQYQRLIKERKNEHFPTLNGSMKVYVPDEDVKKNGKGNKSKKKNGGGPG